MRELVELLDAVREADGELGGEELGGAEEGALRHDQRVSLWPRPRTVPTRAYL